MATINEELIGGKEKDIYFIISYQRTGEEIIDELIIPKSNKIPINIYTNEIKGENGTYYYNKVYKLKNIIQEERSNNPINYSIEIVIGYDKIIRV
jgi:hypothetical protein